MGKFGIDAVGLGTAMTRSKAFRRHGFPGVRLGRRQSAAIGIETDPHVIGPNSPTAACRQTEVLRTRYRGPMRTLRWWADCAQASSGESLATREI